jgi:hypothetical protein
VQKYVFPVLMQKIINSDKNFKEKEEMEVKSNFKFIL